MKERFSNLSAPVKIGIIFAAIAIVLTVVGVVRDPGTPVNLWTLTVGSLISGAMWGLVSWAIATAAVAVENDVQDDGA